MCLDAEREKISHICLVKYWRSRQCIPYSQSSNSGTICQRHKIINGMSQIHRLPYTLARTHTHQHHIHIVYYICIFRRRSNYEKNHFSCVRMFATCHLHTSVCHQIFVLVKYFIAFIYLSLRFVHSNGLVFFIRKNICVASRLEIGLILIKEWKRIYKGSDTRRRQQQQRRFTAKHTGRIQCNECKFRRSIPRHTLALMIYERATAYLLFY